MNAPTWVPEVSAAPAAEGWAPWRAAFLAHLAQRRQSPATLHIRQRWLVVFEGYCRRRGVHTPAALSNRQQQGFQQDLTGLHCTLGRPYGPAAQQMLLNTVRVFYRWAVSTGRLPTECLQGMPCPRGGRPRPSTPAGPWGHWQSCYLEGLRSRGYALATVKIRAHWLTVFERLCRTLGLDHPAAVTHTHLEHFQVCMVGPQPHLGGAVYALHSQQAALCTVRLFLRWAVKTGRLFLDPTADCSLFRVLGPRRPVPSIQQMAALLHPPPRATRHALRDWAVLELLYSTAVRVSECAALDLNDLNVRDGWLRIRHGKGGTQRLLPVGPHLVTVLQRYLTESRPRFVKTVGEPALFLAQQGGRRLSSQSIQLLVRRAGHRLDLHGLSPHTFRRACATHLLLQGADIEAVQRQLGHQHLDTTDRYVELPPTALQAEHARTHPRGVMATQKCTTEEKRLLTRMP